MLCAISLNCTNEWMWTTATKKRAPRWSIRSRHTTFWGNFISLDEQMNGLLSSIGCIQLSDLFSDWFWFLSQLKKFEFWKSRALCLNWIPKLLIQIFHRKKRIRYKTETKSMQLFLADGSFLVHGLILQWPGFSICIENMTLRHE